METIVRKEWGSPLGKFQEFTPQEFVAACIPLSELSGRHIDLYGAGYGTYDSSNDELIVKSASGRGWAPVLDGVDKSRTYTVDVYRWCHRQKPTYWGDNNWDDLWTAATCIHQFGGNYGPNGVGGSWSWFDGHDRNGWNSINGHFVKQATAATLHFSASGNMAWIEGVIDGYSGPTTSAS